MSDSERYLQDIENDPSQTEESIKSIIDNKASSLTDNSLSIQWLWYEGILFNVYTSEYNTGWIDLNSKFEYTLKIENSRIRQNEEPLGKQFFDIGILELDPNYEVLKDYIIKVMFPDKTIQNVDKQYLKPGIMIFRVIDFFEIFPLVVVFERTREIKSKGPYEYINFLQIHFSFSFNDLYKTGSHFPHEFFKESLFKNLKLQMFQKLFKSVALLRVQLRKYDRSVNVNIAHVLNTKFEDKLGRPFLSDPTNQLAQLVAEFAGTKRKTIKKQQPREFLEVDTDDPDYQEFLAAKSEDVDEFFDDFVGDSEKTTLDSELQLEENAGASRPDFREESGAASAFIGEEGGGGSYRPLPQSLTLRLEDQASYRSRFGRAGSDGVESGGGGGAGNNADSGGLDFVPEEERIYTVGEGNDDFFEPSIEIKREGRVERFDRLRKRKAAAAAASAAAQPVVRQDVSLTQNDDFSQLQASSSKKSRTDGDEEFPSQLEKSELELGGGIVETVQKGELTQKPTLEGGVCGCDKSSTISKVLQRIERSNSQDSDILWGGEDFHLDPEIIMNDRLSIVHEPTIEFI